jgi:hypothetical protein
VNSRGGNFHLYLGWCRRKCQISKTGEKVKFEMGWMIIKVTLNTHFELRILEDEITKCTFLTGGITLKRKLKSLSFWWENQVSGLKHVIGSI